MNITIPVRFSQVGSFLAGFLLAWCLFGNGPANADEKPGNDTTQEQMVKRTYMMVHDLYLLEVDGSPMNAERTKHLWLPIELVPAKARYKSPTF